MTGNHGGGGGPENHDDAPSHAQRCRTLVTSAVTATLSTWARDPDGFPYGSLVAVAADPVGSPLLLLSTMAEHRQNLDARNEASILIAQSRGPDENPLALGRVTLLGRCARVSATSLSEVRRTFLERHPDAQGYVDFRDFAFYRLKVEAVRYIGGFGRMSWVNVGEYQAATADAITAPSTP